MCNCAPSAARVRVHRPTGGVVSTSRRCTPVRSSRGTIRFRRGLAGATLRRCCTSRSYRRIPDSFPFGRGRFSAADLHRHYRLPSTFRLRCDRVAPGSLRTAFDRVWRWWTPLHEIRDLRCSRIMSSTGCQRLVTDRRADCRVLTFNRAAATSPASRQSRRSARTRQELCVFRPASDAVATLIQTRSLRVDMEYRPAEPPAISSEVTMMPSKGRTGTSIRFHTAELKRSSATHAAASASPRGVLAAGLRTLRTRWLRCRFHPGLRRLPLTEYQVSSGIVLGSPAPHRHDPFLPPTRVTAFSIARLDLGTVVQDAALLLRTSLNRGTVTPSMSGCPRSPSGTKPTKTRFVRSSGTSRATACEPCRRAGGCCCRSKSTPRPRRTRWCSACRIPVGASRPRRLTGSFSRSGARSSAGPVLALPSSTASSAITGASSKCRQPWAWARRPRAPAGPGGVGRGRGGSAPFP